MPGMEPEHLLGSPQPRGHSPGMLQHLQQGTSGRYPVELCPVFILKVDLQDEHRSMNNTARGFSSQGPFKQLHVCEPNALRTAPCCACSPSQDTIRRMPSTLRGELRWREEGRCMPEGLCARGCEEQGLSAQKQHSTPASAGSGQPKQCESPRRMMRLIMPGEQPGWGSKTHSTEKATG